MHLEQVTQSFGGKSMVVDRVGTLSHFRAVIALADVCICINGSVGWTRVKFDFISAPSLHPYTVATEKEKPVETHFSHLAGIPHLADSSPAASPTACR